MNLGTDESLGAPAEEARRLLDALGGWLSDRLDTVDEHLATGSTECQICPVCQLIGVLRGDRPEVMARLSEAWLAFLGVLAAPASPPADPGSDPPCPAGGTGPDPPPDSPARPVQRIRVD